jgi:hypothetical protein
VGHRLCPAACRAGGSRAHVEAAKVGRRRGPTALPGCLQCRGHGHTSRRGGSDPAPAAAAAAAAAPAQQRTRPRCDSSTAAGCRGPQSPAHLPPKRHPGGGSAPLHPPRRARAGARRGPARRCRAAEQRQAGHWQHETSSAHAAEYASHQSALCLIMLCCRGVSCQAVSQRVTAAVPGSAMAPLGWGPHHTHL